MNQFQIAGNERIAVDLKTLLDLAKPAAALKLGSGTIRASQGGHYLSRFKGRGMAFDETRLYQPGDDVRRIDWRVTARTDKPHSKIYREERERPMFIAVDYRASMQFATRGVFKAVQAARLAALLAWAAWHQGDRIGGQIFAEHGCQEFKPQNGKAAVLRFLNALVRPDFAGDPVTGLDQPLARLLHHARPGSRVYILSDFRGLNAAAENHLAYLARHCDIVLVQIFDPFELALPASGRFRLVDRWRELIVDAADRRQAEAHRQRFEQRQTLLQRLSKQLRLSWLQCSTQQLPRLALGPTLPAPGGRA
ncbi:DUF58 domain-containing protein [Methylomonas sp. 2B]|uniref:DUF58 domain-containing protein n=1 Tax=Methylomonas sp. 2B TaxID=3367743 RepID=UPI0037CC01EB